MNALRWILVVLLLFVGLFILSNVLGTFDNGEDNLAQYAQQQQNNPNKLDGAQLMKNFGCVGCHGNNLEGTINGPELVNLAEYWNRDNLINYLRNPKGFANSDRFEEYKKKYSKVIMPSYESIDVKDLGTIADYLLAK